MEETNSGSPSPIIELNEEFRERLQAKLQEYEKRWEAKVANEGPYDHPEAKFTSSTYYKKELAAKLLAQGKVDTHEFSRELFTRHNECFDPDNYNTACGVLHDYMLTGGEHTLQSTGF